jgi:hypothetical protein
MKTRNEPVAVVAGFAADGTVRPLSFRHGNREYRVKLIKWWKYGAPVWSDNASRLYCVCTDDDRVAELELCIEAGVWRLVKM